MCAQLVYMMEYLPEDCIIYIFSFTNTSTMTLCKQVCKQLAHILDRHKRMFLREMISTVDLIEWNFDLRELPNKWLSVMLSCNNNVVSSNHAHIIEYVLSYYPEYKFVQTKMVEVGHIDCLKYIHNHGYKLNLAALAYAADNIEILTYLHTNGATLCSSVATNAAISGSLECLEYAHKNGCEISSHIMEYAIHGQNVECVKYLHTNGVQLTDYDLPIAAYYSTYEIYRYLYDNGCNNVNKTIYNMLCRNSDIRGFKYTYKHGHALPSNIVLRTVKADNAKLLKYLNKIKCPMRDDIYTAVIEHNSIKCARYLHRIGYKFGINAYEIAINNNYIVLFKVLHKNIEFVPPKMMELAIRHKRSKIFDYIYSQNIRIPHIGKLIASYGTCMMIETIKRNDAYLRETMSTIIELKCIHKFRYTVDYILDYIDDDLLHEILLFDWRPAFCHIADRYNTDDIIALADKYNSKGCLEYLKY